MPVNFHTVALFAFIAGTALAAPSVQAQSLDEFAKCVGIGNDIERLACFDRVAAPMSGPDTAAAECRQMTVEDLKLDYQDLVGTCAEVTGLLLQAGDTVMLMQSQMDANPFMVDATELTRDERRILLNCPTGCRLTVTGTVGEYNYSKGMKAASIRQ